MDTAMRRSARCGQTRFARDEKRTPALRTSPDATDSSALEA
jgi:hypothetical protein